MSTFAGLNKAYLIGRIKSIVDHTPVVPPRLSITLATSSCCKAGNTWDEQEDVHLLTALGNVAQTLRNVEARPGQALAVEAVLLPRTVEVRITRILWLSKVSADDD